MNKKINKKTLISCIAAMSCVLTNVNAEDDGDRYYENIGRIWEEVIERYKAGTEKNIDSLLLKILPIKNITSVDYKATIDGVKLMDLTNLEGITEVGYKMFFKNVDLSTAKKLSPSSWICTTGIENGKIYVTNQDGIELSVSEIKSAFCL